MCTYMDRLEIEDIICKWGEDKYVDTITIFMMWIIKPCEKMVTFVLKRNFPRDK